MKVIVLRKDGDRWEQVGAVEIEQIESMEGLAPETLAMLQQDAVKELAARGGVFVAIPMEVWTLFEAEASVTVRPVPRVGAEPAQALDDEPFHDPELEGMTQRGRLPE